MLLAGCGGGGDANADACAALAELPAAVDANPVTTLRSLVAAEERAAAAAQGALADELNGTLGRARLTLGSVMSDPLRSGSMSPTGTVAPFTRRALAEAVRLRDTYC